MMPAFITSPALLIAAIAGTGALMGGVIVWARNRQQRRAEAARALTPNRDPLRGRPAVEPGEGERSGR